MKKLAIADIIYLLLRTRMSALKVVKTADSKISRHQDDVLETKLLAFIKGNPAATQKQMFAVLEIPIAALRRIMKKLNNSGRRKKNGCDTKG